MYYTRLWILLSLFIVGCSSTPTPTKTTLKELQNSRTNALNNDLTAELAIYQQAITELNNNNLIAAEKSFQKMTNMQPDLAGPWANLALLYLKQDLTEKAEQNIKTALSKNPNMPQALNLAGYIQNQKGKIIEAKVFYEKAIKNKPDYALAHFNLALLYDVYLQNISMAIQHYQLYLSLIDNKDQNTKDWVEELKLNIKSDDV